MPSRPPSENLKPGEILDGEGGYAVWANAIPASKSLALRGLPIGLAHNVKLKRPVPRDNIVSVDDVELVDDLDVVALRREMEAADALAHSFHAALGGTRFSRTLRRRRPTRLSAMHFRLARPQSGLRARWKTLTADVLTRIFWPSRTHRDYSWPEAWMRAQCGQCFGAHGGLSLHARTGAHSRISLETAMAVVVVPAQYEIPTGPCIFVTGLAGRRWCSAGPRDGDLRSFPHVAQPRRRGKCERPVKASVRLS